MFIRHHIMNFGAKGLGNIQRGRCVNTQAFSFPTEISPMSSFPTAPLTLCSGRSREGCPMTHVPPCLKICFSFERVQLVLHTKNPLPRKLLDKPTCGNSKWSGPCIMKTPIHLPPPLPTHTHTHGQTKSQI